ncbi:putative S-adenosylmethionine-dependent methyltransferase [compost metagenome]
MLNPNEFWNQAFGRSGLEPHYDDWLDKYKEELDRCSGRTILDLGCGIGNNAKYLTERGHKVLCCDQSEVALEKLRAFVPEAETKRLNMLEGLSFADGSFPLVIADLSLHYFDEADTFRIVRDIHRVLEEGGLLLCRLNSIRSLPVYTGYYIEVGGLMRRYFDREQVDYYFGNDLWEKMTCLEYPMDRYFKGKIVWEMPAKKRG